MRYDTTNTIGGDKHVEIYYNGWLLSQRDSIKHASRYLALIYNNSPAAVDCTHCINVGWLNNHPATVAQYSIISA